MATFVLRTKTYPNSFFFSLQSLCYNDYNKCIKVCYSHVLRTKHVAERELCIKHACHGVLYGIRLHIVWCSRYRLVTTNRSGLDGGCGKSNEIIRS